MTYSLPALSYHYNALEPYFDEKTMKIHHTKHHQAYIDNTNEIIKKNHLEKISINELIKTLQEKPESIRNKLRNNAGGHANHTLFWKILKPNTKITTTFKKIIENQFKTLTNFFNVFEKVALDRFGSGWVWLVKKDNILEVVSTANQDNPLMGKEITGVNDSYPVFGLDLWEHAYYLKYQNKKSDYIKAFWKIINWQEVESRFFHNEKLV
ncbi:Fe-Mn family superoxide dismutase [Candidatus Tachikawaea gelatinosa]|uniref:Superoxide dismutase n=1 Tax=Candidatus Tachikawaea gelatinosa TaxID=1410383 RepID=A0A090AR52_9ENTR|nr:Fe-Mn family superoxide dismutase [Candidatus Tachikawaea gelatinosa]BAP58842.1 superoxide dismutase [Candidatus Tachikawaea gelatinosa]